MLQDCWTNWWHTKELHRSYHSMPADAASSKASFHSQLHWTKYVLCTFFSLFLFLVRIWCSGVRNVTPGQLCVKCQMLSRQMLRQQVTLLLFSGVKSDKFAAVIVFFTHFCCCCHSVLCVHICVSVHAWLLAYVYVCGVYNLSGIAIPFHLWNGPAISNICPKSSNVSSFVS